jgi:hypothetical protein
MGSAIRGRSMSGSWRNLRLNVGGAIGALAGFAAGFALVVSCSLFQLPVLEEVTWLLPTVAGARAGNYCWDLAARNRD